MCQSAVHAALRSTTTLRCFLCGLLTSSLFRRSPAQILARKQKNLEYQAYLEQQVRDKEARRPVNWVMTQRERQLNSHLLVNAAPVVNHILP